MPRLKPSPAISIHALRVEGDRSTPKIRLISDVISIHALRVEGDLNMRERMYTCEVFLSTPSGWRATLPSSSINFNSRSISIHALRVEGDSKNGQSFHLFLRKREKNLPL